MPRLYKTFKDREAGTTSTLLTSEGKAARQFIVRTPFYTWMWGFFIVLALLAIVVGVMLIDRTYGISLLWGIGVATGLMSTPVIVSAILHSIALSAIWAQTEQERLARVQNTP